MTKEHEFKTRLEQGGAQTEAGRNSRAYAIRTIERNLAALGRQADQGPLAALDENTSEHGPSRRISVTAVAPASTPLLNTGSKYRFIKTNAAGEQCWEMT